jgi:hypothetical protein
MTLVFLLRNSITLAAGVIFGVTGGYLVSVLGLGYGPIVILVLFGLVLLFAITAAAQVIAARLSRLAAERIGPRVTDLALPAEGWHIRSRLAVFIAAYAGGVLFAARIPLDILGKMIGGY